MKHFLPILAVTLLFTACQMKPNSTSTPAVPSDYSRGAAQMAALWTEADGTAEEMAAFIEANECKTPEEKHALYLQLAHILETITQYADMTYVELLRPTTLTGTEPGVADWMITSYSPLAHLSDDLFANKIAFLTVLNFPHYSLEEKDSIGVNWTRDEWAYAKLGDVFASRVPAAAMQKVVDANADAECYIADYNIMMKHLLTADGRRLWDEDLSLLSHWNLRDELKSDYDNQEKQEMIYQVMQRIVKQEIPAMVINSREYDWCPYTNEVFAADGQSVKTEREKDVRYEKILAHFHAYLEEDKYRPDMPTAIQRNFEGSMQMTAKQIETLFTELVSSPELKEVGALIRKRLGRDLRPYDIWYNGFKSRATVSEDALTAITRKRYPTPAAFEADMPRMLRELGFQPAVADEICSHIAVEPARGSGHAWPAVGRQEKALLRTRIAPTGMDYKGYNIAVHEFGHNTEEVVSLYFNDHYMLAGIPATGFTEASAFLFQSRDMELLTGQKSDANSPESVLDQVWGMYEIMGVSLVDMRMWQWLYAHPEATAAELKEATLRIAAEVWDAYYEPILGEKGCCLLAIYSHMVNSPMYLPNYPIGTIVRYQLEAHFANLEPAEWAEEYMRVYRQGCLTPNAWMRGATGTELSIEPILKATREACSKSK